MKPFYTIFWLIMATCTAMTGHSIHHSLFWSCMDFIFWPFTIVKWLICHEVNLTIIKSTFSFFFN